MWKAPTDATEYELHKMSCEASECGIKPGQGWPPQVEANGIGNGLPFLYTGQGHDCADYLQQFGCVQLRIFND